MFSGLVSAVSGYVFGQGSPTLKGKLYKNDVDCMIGTLNFKSTEKFEHFLYIQEEEGDSNISFLLCKTMKFRVFVLDQGDHFYQWIDEESDNLDVYKFLIDILDDDRAMDVFRDVVGRIYEYECEDAMTNASNSDLASIEDEMRKEENKLTTSSSTTTPQKKRVETPKKQTPPPKTPTPKTPTPKTPASQTPRAEYFNELKSPNKTPRINNNEDADLGVLDGHSLEVVTADLYLWDLDEEWNNLEAQFVSVSFNRISEETYETMMYVVKGSKALVSERCTSEMNICTNRQTKTIGWNSKEDGSFKFWSLEFHDTESFDKCNALLTKFIYEFNYSQSLHLKDDDLDYLGGLNMEMDIDCYDEEKELSDFEDDDLEEEEEEEEVPSFSAPRSTKKNMNMTVSGKYNRTFVSRGKEIAVFETDADEPRLKYQNSINEIKSKNGIGISPQKMLLHDGDRSLLMLTPATKGKIHKMDIEYGQVIEEWTPHRSGLINPTDEDAFQTRDIVAAQKMDYDNATIVGVSRNQIYNIDPRVKSGEVADDKLYSYKGKTDLTCGATSRNGYLVCGSDKGEIRMYTGKGKYDKRAKTLLPGLGDPVVGIDVTADGNWVLATCSNYLVVVCTKFTNDKGDEKNGFQIGMGKHKPRPLKLTIAGKHLAYMQEPVNFVRARFDLNERGERYIVASSGHFAIKWKFSDIKKRKTDSYTIKRFDELVVGDQFNPGNNKDVVFVTEHREGIVKAKQFMTPTKKRLSFMPNEIVNSPF